MASPYVVPTISGYNSTPPTNDGSVTELNQLNWDSHIDKIGDPLKNFSDSINAALVTAFGVFPFNSLNAQTGTYTVQAGDREKLITASGTFTITLLAAATAEDGFVVHIKNISTGIVTIDCDGSETIDGAANYVLSASPAGVSLRSDGSNWSVVSDSAGENLRAIGALETTDGAIIVGDGTTFVLESGATARASLGVEAPTREFFVQAEAAGSSGNTGQFPIFDMGVGGVERWAFFMPFDLTTLTVASIVMIPDATETIQLDLDTDYGAVGEQYNTHTGQLLNQTLAVTSGQLAEFDFTGVLASVAANDYVGLKITSDIASLRIIGFRFKYT